MLLFFMSFVLFCVVVFLLFLSFLLLFVIDVADSSVGKSCCSWSSPVRQSCTRVCWPRRLPPSHAFVVCSLRLVVVNVLVSHCDRYKMEYDRLRQIAEAEAAVAALNVPSFNKYVTVAVLI
jgi:hypothetical protein